MNTLAGSLTLYLGTPIFVVGLGGNLLNLRLLWRTRRNPCAFYFLVSSLVNCFVLILGLLTRILSVSFQLDWAHTNLIWCKTRAGFSQASSFVSLTLLCLTSIDRYLITSRRDQWRQLSRLSISHWLALTTVLFWCFHTIPNIVFADLIPVSATSFVCGLRPNAVFAFYQTYISLPVYLGVCPSVILLASGLLTFRNTRHMQGTLQRTSIQKQLTQMMLVQIPLIVCSTLPYVIFTEYSILTARQPKSNERRALESLLSNIFTLLFYVTFSMQFPIFLFSSSTFRQEAKLFFTGHFKPTQLIHPQPLTQPASK